MASTFKNSVLSFSQYLK